MEAYPAETGRPWPLPLLRPRRRSVRGSGDRWLLPLPWEPWSRLSFSRRTISRKRRSKARLRTSIVQIDTHVELPIMISSHSMTCCQVVIWLRLTV